MNLFDIIVQKVTILVDKFNDPKASPQASPEQLLAELILKRNGSYVRTYPSTFAAPPLIDAQIHKVSSEVAAQVAALIVRECDASLPIAYLAACIFQESQFDTQCFNHNLTEWKGLVNFDGTDWGIAQNSGHVARSFPGFGSLTEAAMETKLCDPGFAIPQMAATMKANLAWARQELSFNASISSNPSGLLVRSIGNLPASLRYDWTTKTIDQTAYWMATLAYNRGRTGCLEMINKQRPPVSHGHSVQTWMLEFAPILSPELVGQMK
jgi:hypothetical protein